MRDAAASCVALAACLLVLLACGFGPSLKSECQKTRIGEPMTSARARLNKTGATHKVSGSLRKNQELWQRMVGLGAMSCYLDYDASGRVTKVDYHEGN